MAVSSWPVEVGDGRLQVGAALARRAGEGRVGEMLLVLDAGAPVLGGDLHVEVGDHAAELLDHRLDLADLPAALLDLEPLHADRSVS